MSDVGIITAQNISIDFRLAGIGDRMGAFIIDILVIAAYIFLITYVLEKFPLPEDYEWMIILCYLPVIFYHFIFEYLMQGQSPGKKQMKIRVLKEEGAPATLGSFFLRWILSPVDYFFTGGIAVISIIMTSKGQRLGDLAAGTIIVKEKKLASYNKSFFHKPVDESHQIEYPSVKHRIEQSDIDLIKEALRVRIDNQVLRPAERIREIIEKKLEVKTDLATVDFLHRVIRDFAFLHSDESDTLK